MNANVPASIGELQALVKAHDRIHVVGNGSKPALHHGAGDAALAGAGGFCGIIEYQPQEFTLTAGAGTPVSVIAAELKRHGQYLPFDPLLPNSSTIGGTVAANLSGARRYRYGGIRDFILGARVVDGLGRAFRVGGKVVKNAAGFDLSKFLVGSLGRYAIMTELTFKVFPEPPQHRALRLRYAALPDVLDAVYYLNQNINELDALEFAPADAGWSLLLCLAGFEDTLPSRILALQESLRADTAGLDGGEGDDVNAAWQPLAGLTGDYLVKVALAPKQIPGLDARVSHLKRRYSIGGNLAWVATDDLKMLDALLLEQGLRGLCIRGAASSPLLGMPLEDILSARVKQVLDPMNKFV